MDIQIKLSTISKSTDYLSKLQIDNKIKELLVQELKCKQKIKNKQMNHCKLKKKLH